MTWDEVVELGRKHPGVEVGTSYGTPALKVRNKLLVRLRPEDASLVLSVDSLDEREFLIESDPTVFHTTPHYRDYPAVLARMAEITPDQLWPFVLRAWRVHAPKKVVSAYDQE